MSTSSDERESALDAVEHGADRGIPRGLRLDEGILRHAVRDTSGGDFAGVTSCFIVARRNSF